MDRDVLTLGMLSVCYGISNDTLEEGLQHTTGLLIDHSTNSLHASSTRKTTDSRFCDTLDVVTKNLDDD